MESDNLIRKPFEKKYLDEEKKKQDVFSIKLNPKQRKELNAAKRTLHIDRDSTAYKLLASIGQKVIFNILGPEIAKFLSDERRVRYEQEGPAND